MLLTFKIDFGGPVKVKRKKYFLIQVDPIPPLRSHSEPFNKNLTFLLYLFRSSKTFRRSKITPSSTLQTSWFIKRKSHRPSESHRSNSKLYCFWQLGCFNKIVEQKKWFTIGKLQISRRTCIRQETINYRTVTETLFINTH